jgi:hypothetical protein
MKTYDFTTNTPPEPNVFDFTQPEPLLAIDEKINYIADLLETALKMEYLRCTTR